MRKLLLTSAVLAALATPIVASATAAAPVAKPVTAATMEKCYGVAKAGMNDCAALSHSCKGNAKTNSAAEDWVNVPNGLCAKLANGSLTTAAKKS